jgi:hypothetical protein
MSTIRIDAHINSIIWDLLRNSPPFAQLARRTIYTAARAQEARGKRALFGFGRHLWPDAHAQFESSAQDLLDAMEEVRAFQMFSRGPCTYWVLMAILAGNLNHPDMETSRQYWEWLKQEYFQSWCDLKPGKQLLSL